MSIPLRHQAEAVEVTMMEYRSSVERYASLAQKRMRVDALDAAQQTLHRLADRAEARRAAAEGEDAPT